MTAGGGGIHDWNPSNIMNSRPLTLLEILLVLKSQYILHEHQGWENFLDFMTCFARLSKHSMEQEILARTFCLVP
jgi:hypothetical protein